MLTRRTSPSCANRLRRIECASREVKRHFDNAANPIYGLIALLVAVYPANLYMTWDWRDRSASEQVISWLRLPLQFVLIAAAHRASGPWHRRPPLPAA